MCDDVKCGRVSTFVVEHGVMMKMQRAPCRRDKNQSVWYIRTVVGEKCEEQSDANYEYMR